MHGLFFCDTDRPIREGLETKMVSHKALLACLGGAVGVALLAVAPAIGAASDSPFFKKAPASALRGGIGSFTPAAGDPRLAASFARAGVSASGFRFTPTFAIGKARAITVAVRSQTNQRPVENDRLPTGAAATLGIAPVAYSLGAGVGWKRFALSGDIARVDNGLLPGSRQSYDVGVSYNANKWSTRVQLAADRPIGNLPRSITGGNSVSLDVASSYRLTRNLDVTAGVRVKRERDRLEGLTDSRRDSQAVYVGTAFRF